MSAIPITFTDFSPPVLEQLQVMLRGLTGDVTPAALAAQAAAEAAAQEAIDTLDSTAKKSEVAAEAGLPMLAFTAAEAQGIFDNGLPLQNYAALRAYDGRAKTVQITGLYTLAAPDGISGPYRRDDTDTTSSDNGAAVIIDALGRRWHRITDAFTFGHFGAIGNYIADDTVAIRNAVDFALTNICDIHGVAGRQYRVTGETNFPKKHSGVIREYITVDGHGCRIFIDGTGITAFGFTKAVGGGLLDATNYYLIFKNINFGALTGSGCIAIRPAGFVTSQYINLHFTDVDYPFYAIKADPRNTPDYVQSARILGCYSVHHKRFFTAPRVYDFVMDDTILDAAIDGILIDFGSTGQSAYSMRITNSIIQSQSGIGVAVGGATGMVIDSNYWENNGREFVALHTGTVINYGGCITNNFIQAKASPPVERLAAFDLGGCSTSGFKLGGNSAQDQKLYNWTLGLSSGYFDTTNDRSGVTAAILYDPVTRPSTVRSIFSAAHRYGWVWGADGAMVVNPISRGIEYSHTEYDYLDATDNVRIPIVVGVARIAPAGFGGGLDGLGVSPAQAPSLYPQKGWAKGSVLTNPTPSETTNISSIASAFVCVTAGRPGTWVENRIPTKRFTDILNVDGPNARVGVNTAAPTVPFQVTGASRFYGNGSFSIGWGDSSDLGRLSSASGVPSISGLANGLNLNTTTSVPITFTTNSVERVRIDGAGNLLVGGTATPTAAQRAVVISNGAAPTASVADGVALYAEDVSASSELKVRDEAGNVTTLSPHNFTLIPGGKSEEMAWAYYSEKGGRRINVDMLKLARLVESVTGETLVYVE